jgi:hypothetical protein
MLKRPQNGKRITRLGTGNAVVEGPVGTVEGGSVHFSIITNPYVQKNEVSRGVISHLTPSSRRNYPSSRRGRNLAGLGMDRESRRAYGVAKS